MDYNARYYNPRLGRFISADTVVPDFEDIQSPDHENPHLLNRYAYVRSNPLTYNDPTGNVANCAWSCDPQDNYVSDPPPPPEPPQPPDEPPSGEEPLDFVAPWETDRLDAVGGRLNVSGWIPNFPILGGDISVDVVYNANTDKLSAFLTPGGLIGIGEGADMSIGGIGHYDSEDNSEFVGWGGGAQGAIIPAIGGQAAWAFSFSRGATGKHPQMWHGAIGGGAEFSASGTLGYSIEVLRWSEGGTWLLPDTIFERKLD